jgi:hypothetical protein
MILCSAHCVTDLSMHTAHISWFYAAACWDAQQGQ